MTFSDFPDMTNGLRLVGSTLLDEEQFLVERWHDYRGEWRPTVAGIHAYAELRASRKAERKAVWQSRQEDDPYSDSIQQLIESKGESNA